MGDPGPGRSITLPTVENTLQFRFNFRRQRNNGRIIDQPKNAGRIHEADVDFAGRIFAHENIARQQQTDIGYCAYRLMCKNRIARAKNAVGRHVFAEFLFHRGRNVNVRQNTEALNGKFSRHFRNCCVECQIERFAKASLIGFGGAEDSTLVQDPTSPGNFVAKVTKSGTAELWAGTSMSTAGPSGRGFATPIPFSAGQTTMSVRVWSPDAGIPVRLKVEDASDVTHAVETEALTTTAYVWETLVFDFSNEAFGTRAFNLAFTYNTASADFRPSRFP